MKLPSVRPVVRRIIVAALALASMVGHALGQGQPSLKVQLVAYQERHRWAVERYHQERPSSERAAVRARYQEERRQDLGNLLDQVQKHLDNPAAFPALQFVVMADHEGVIGVLDRTVAVLARDHISRPGIGSYCRL